MFGSQGLFKFVSLRLRDKKSHDAKYGTKLLYAVTQRVIYWLIFDLRQLVDTALLDCDLTKRKKSMRKMAVIRLAIAAAAAAPPVLIVETKRCAPCDTQSEQASSNQTISKQNHLVGLFAPIEAYGQTHSDATIYSPNWEQTTLDRLMKNKTRDCASYG